MGEGGESPRAEDVGVDIEGGGGLCSEDSTGWRSSFFSWLEIMWFCGGEECGFSEWTIN